MHILRAGGGGPTVMHLGGITGVGASVPGRRQDAEAA